MFCNLTIVLCSYMLNKDRTEQVDISRPKIISSFKQTKGPEAVDIAVKHSTTVKEGTRVRNFEILQRTTCLLSSNSTDNQTKELLNVDVDDFDSEILSNVTHLAVLNAGNLGIFESQMGPEEFCKLSYKDYLSVKYPSFTMTCKNRTLVTVTENSGFKKSTGSKNALVSNGEDAFNSWLTGNEDKSLELTQRHYSKVFKTQKEPSSTMLRNFTEISVESNIHRIKQAMSEDDCVLEEKDDSAMGKWCFFNRRESKEPEEGTKIKGFKSRKESKNEFGLGQLDESSLWNRRMSTISEPRKSESFW